MEYSEEIFNFLSIVIPSGNGVQRCYQSPNEKRNRLDIISRGDLRLTLTKLTPNVDNFFYFLCYFIYSLFYVYWCLTNKCPHWE
ncbi:unnamed protein product [Acanthoscelides obtectus]|uniref:Uncharacterized protein n=1 Tax=Acanthoscelides obtectus TaxID=200917 RepID=A0A9P0KWS8_ACAOB|nr:unnamed protein product [Acanthoscelides obtectus]CAK1650952.1 hypothetical protein AOBTE_LOCUS16987 [Acanthoscelides obtectus]